MEAAIVYWGYIGIMEKKMEATVYNGIILGLYSFMFLQLRALSCSTCQVVILSWVFYVLAENFPIKPMSFGGKMDREPPHQLGHCEHRCCAPCCGWMMTEGWY